MELGKGGWNGGWGKGMDEVEGRGMGEGGGNSFKERIGLGVGRGGTIESRRGSVSEEGFGGGIGVGDRLIISDWLRGGEMTGGRSTGDERGEGGLNGPYGEGRGMDDENGRISEFFGGKRGAKGGGKEGRGGLRDLGKRRGEVVAERKGEGGKWGGGTEEG
ncbi:hypothetical protein Tco_1043262 [Tanacetum coccineum]|uniref:Uncharacterized protein n=1 Tax=Tanacetum coccineum TaxID=301880 RepID=A0ABQ5GNR2_9ASTR